MDYYTRNRDRILAVKRLRYHADPELRAKKQVAALARYYRLKGADPTKPENGSFLPPTFSSLIDNGA